MDQHQHSFGGSRLDRYVFDFEPELPAGEVNLGNFREGSDAPYAAVLDSLGLSDAATPPAPGEPAPFAQVTPIEAALATPADPYAAPAPAAPAPAAAHPVPVATDPYAAPVPAEPVVQAELTPAWVQNIETSFAQLGQQLAALGAPAAPVEPAAPVIDFDTASGDEIRAYLDQAVGQAREETAQLVQQQFEQRFGPVMPLLDTFVASQAETAAEKHFAGLAPVVGKFDAKEAYVRARAIFAEHPQGDPEQVLLLAARQQHEVEKRQWEEFKTLTGQTATAVAGAPPVAPVAPAAASEIRPVPQGPDRYEVARQEFFARRNVQPVTA